jgi:hypothetical protein
MLEKQIIGRAQRTGRNKKLNLWYLMHENESIIVNKKKSNNNYFEREKSILEFSNLIEENYDKDAISGIINSSVVFDTEKFTLL